MVKHWIVHNTAHNANNNSSRPVGGHAGHCQQLARVGPRVEKVECGEKYFRILSITTDYALARGRLLGQDKNRSHGKQFGRVGGLSTSWLQKRIFRKETLSLLLAFEQKGRVRNAREAKRGRQSGRQQGNNEGRLCVKCSLWWVTELEELWYQHCCPMQRGWAESAEQQILLR